MNDFNLLAQSEKATSYRMAAVFRKLKSTVNTDKPLLRKRKRVKKPPPLSDVPKKKPALAPAKARVS
jgi:hypothetical protein